MRPLAVSTTAKRPWVEESAVDTRRAAIKPTVEERFSTQRQWSERVSPQQRPDWVAEMRADATSRFCAFPLDLLDSVLLPYVQGPSLMGRLPADLRQLDSPALSMALPKTGTVLSLSFPLFSVEPALHSHIIGAEPTVAKGHAPRIFFVALTVKNVHLVTQTGATLLAEWMVPCSVTQAPEVVSLATRRLNGKEASGPAPMFTYTVGWLSGSMSIREVALSPYDVVIAPPGPVLLPYPPSVPELQWLESDELGLPVAWGCEENTLIVARVTPGSEQQSAQLDIRRYGLPFSARAVLTIHFGPSSSGSLWVLVRNPSLGRFAGRVELMEFDAVHVPNLRQMHRFQCNYLPSTTPGEDWKLLADSHNRLLVCRLEYDCVRLLDLRGEEVGCLRVGWPRSVYLSPQGCLVVWTRKAQAVWFF